MPFPAAEAIADVVRPAAAGRGLDIEEVKVAGARVAVLVDGDESPDLDAIEAVTRDISAALDEAEAAGEIRFGDRGYTLEVSTPGVDAPLTAPRHWRRNRNRLVRIRLAGGDQVVGRIGALSGDADRVIIVTSTGPKGRPRATGAVLELATVDRAVVEIEFSKAPAVELDLAGLDFDDAVTRLEELDK